MFATTTQESAAGTRPNDADRREPTYVQASPYEPPQHAPVQPHQSQYAQATAYDHPQQQYPYAQQYPSQQQYQQHGQQGSSSVADKAFGAGPSTHQPPPPPPPPPQQQQQYHTRAAEPYPAQQTTWWEQAPTPNPGRAEQGYGPGPTNHQPHHAQQQHHQYQQQHDQFGGHARDDKQAKEKRDSVFLNKVAKIICSILLPPLGVFLETGCDKNLAINVLLTILGYLPGILHALYVILTDK